VDLSNPPKNVTEVPGKAEVAGNSAEHVTVALALLLVMVGMGFAFVQAVEDKNTALAVVFAVVILGCGSVLVVVIRQLLGWLRVR
jgi:hypothetical protein